MAIRATTTIQTALDRWNPPDIVNIGPFFNDLVRQILVATLFGDTVLDDQEQEQTETAIRGAFGFMEKSLWVSWFPNWLISGRAALLAAGATLDRLIYSIIDERRKHAAGSDLLGMLIAVRDEDDGTGMDSKQLRDEVMTMFLAGHETTAIAATWLFPLLDEHPIVLGQLLEEIATLGGRTPTFADLSHLPYTRPVIDELLRVAPPVWLYYRTPLTADRLRNHAVEAGSTVLLSPYLTHRHPAFWSNPTVFDPDRGTPEGKKAMHPCAYFPFSGGKRRCIGNECAIMEVIFITVMVLQRWTLTRTGPSMPRPLVTLRPAQNNAIGAWMHIQARS